MFEQAFKNIDDVLWKDAGCTSELDYSEQTSWLHGFKQKASGPNTIEYKIGEIFGEIKNRIQSCRTSLGWSANHWSCNWEMVETHERSRNPMPRPTVRAQARRAGSVAEVAAAPRFHRRTLGDAP